jgi:protein SCO1/2
MPGDDYEIVTVSINPAETPERALEKKGNYLTLFAGDEARAAGAEKGWHFLTGEEESIRELASAVGFTYRYDAESGQFLHRSVIMFCASDGKLVRYLGGVAFEPRTMRLALLEAAAGQIGSHFDQLFLFCFHYDALTGRYAPVAFNVMRIGGVVTILLLGFFILRLLWRDSRRRKAAAAAEEDDDLHGEGASITTRHETRREPSHPATSPES